MRDGVGRIAIVGNSSNHRGLRELIVNRRNLIKISHMELSTINSEDKLMSSIEKDFKQDKSLEKESKLYDSKRMKRRK